MAISQRRLHAEYLRIKNLQPEFKASPKSNVNGTIDYYTWECIIPGMKNTVWEGGYYPCNLEFSNDYPRLGPQVIFDKKIVHPNIWLNGIACLRVLTKGWKVSISIPEILIYLQKFLNEPDFSLQDWDKIYSTYK